VINRLADPAAEPGLGQLANPGEDRAGDLLGRVLRRPELEQQMIACGLDPDGAPLAK